MIQGARVHHFVLRAGEWRLLLLAGDAATWWAAGAITVALLRPPTFGTSAGPRSIAVMLTAIGAWWVWAWVNGAYQIDIASRLSSLLPALARAAIGQTLVFVGLAFLSHGLTGRVVWSSWLLVAFVFIVAWRMVHVRVFSLQLFARHVLFAGTSAFLTELATITKERGAEHYRVLGYVSRADHPVDAPVGGLPVVGDLCQLPEVAVRLGAEEVVAGREVLDDRSVLETLIACRNRGIKVTPSTELFEQLTRQVPIVEIDPHWVFDLPDRAFQNRSYVAVKRLLDAVLAAIGLLAFGVLLPFVALALWLDSGRPIFYLQNRIGLHGRSFALLKFRTMRQDAESGGARWALPHDKRVTRVGRMLRATRLDELPQVINILKGDMTVVGPRPERPEFVSELEGAIPFYRTRLEVKPGLTGWAQVNKGYGSSVDDAMTKLQYDLYYVKHQSVLLDALIVLRTIGVLIRFRGR